MHNHAHHVRNAFPSSGYSWLIVYHDTLNTIPLAAYENEIRSYEMDANSLHSI